MLGAGWLQHRLPPALLGQASLKMAHEFQRLFLWCAVCQLVERAVYPA